MNPKKLSLLDLAIDVADHLRRSGIDVVLSGGACVSVYAKQAYLSYDLDFVLTRYVPRPKIRAAMTDLGFTEDGRHFRRPGTPFIVEFLSSPLSVGEEPVRVIAEISKRKKTLRLLSPTDCVKDRLAAFYHWNDYPSLEQAILVASHQKVDLKEIRRWSDVEGMSDKLEVFLRALRKRRPRP